MDQDPNKKWRHFENLRSGKHVRRRLRKIESAGVKHAHKFIVKRWENVRDVRRHALSWLLLVGVLIGSLVLQSSLTQQAYQTSVAAESGTYSEAVLGQLDNLNPIYATTQPERAASRLLFSGLLTYDTSGSLRSDLARSWKISNEGKRYEVTLRDNIVWSDGEEVTADDVVFTINTIKELNTGSPLYRSWRDIAVSAPDPTTVVFDLPVAYAPFSHFLTVGIIPEHEFEGIDPADMRSSEFNRNPVGSGPFVFRNLQTVDIESGRSVVHMAANEKYHGGDPKLERFQLHVYGDRDELRKAFSSGEVNAVADLTAQDLDQLEQLEQYEVSDTPINNVALALFKMDSDILSDGQVRKALRLATNQEELIRDALSGRAAPLDTPIPPSLLDNSSEYTQPDYNLAEAEKLLTEAGWVKDEQGKRSKDGRPLRLAVVTIRTGDYPKVLESLSSQWAKIGVTINTVLADPSDVQQNILAPRSYDVLIYELAVGGDPDVYAYWHSSQANMSGLNLANYKSASADDALSSARSRFESDLRGAKYETFVEEWLKDVPGVVLYQPALHYVSRNDISIRSEHSLIDSVDRYRNVHNWSIAQETRHQTP